MTTVLGQVERGNNILGLIVSDGRKVKEIKVSLFNEDSREAISDLPYLTDAELKELMMLSQEGKIETLDDLDLGKIL